MRLGTSAIVARNVDWSGTSSTEPYEASWAGEAIMFVRALQDGVGERSSAYVEISADGIRWVREGTTFELPWQKDEVSFARVSHFGNWLRLSAEFADRSSLRVLVTMHFKS